MTGNIGRRALLIGSVGTVSSAELARVSWAQGKSPPGSQPIRIGIVTDIAGPYSASGGLGSVAAAQLAANDFNNTVCGRPVEVISADHQNKPDLAASIVREWIDKRGVEVVADGGTSPCSLAIQDVCRDRKKTFIISAAASGGFTGSSCSKFGLHFIFDAYALSVSIARAMTAQNAKTWFFIVADYVFGNDAFETASGFIKQAGGTVVGLARHPLGASDFSSQVLMAQASGADVVMLVNSGADTQNALKQAVEFGLPARQRIGTVLMYISDVVALGREAAGGLSFCTSFYWDRNESTRAWSKRFRELRNTFPTSVQAATYSGVRHFLGAANAVGIDDGTAVNDRMRATPVDDQLNDKVPIRADGQLMCNMYLVQVKRPDEAKSPDDYYKILETIPGDKAFRPMSEANCPLVKI